MSRADSASSTVSSEGFVSTAIIDACEERDIMTEDIPNAFMQAPLPMKDGDERIHMKITGAPVDVLVEMDPNLCEPHVVCEKDKKTIHVHVSRAICDMSQAASQWHKMFEKDSESIEFEFNPCDACVANRTRRGTQHTIGFHVDDTMFSHIQPCVNDKFDAWLQRHHETHKPVTLH